MQGAYEPYKVNETKENRCLPAWEAAVLVYFVLPRREFVAQDDVVGAALNDADRGDEGELGPFLQLFDAERAAVAHGGAHLRQRDANVVVQRAGVRNVGIDAFLEGELTVAAEVVALPVAGAVRAFAPIFLVESAVDFHFVGGALVKAREVAAEHQKVRAHGQRQRNVIVVDDAAVGADRNVNTRFLEVFVPCLADVDERRRLAASDAFRFAGDADGAAADADFYEVRAGFGQETEAFGVDDVAGAHFDFRPVFLMDVIERDALPFGVAFRGVDAERVRARVNQKRNALGVVAGIDARADAVAFVRVSDFQFVFFIVRVVLAEDHITQALVFVHQRQHVQFRFPNDVVGLGKGEVGVRVNEAVKGRHEFRDRRVHRHARDTIVAARDDAEELARRLAVFGYGHRGVARLGFELQHFAEGRRWLDIGIAGDEAGFIAFDTAHHLCFLLRRLGAVDEGHAAFLCESDGHGVVGNGLHDGRDHRDI